MRTTTKTARGFPLAVLLVFLLAALAVSASGSGLRVGQTIDPSEVFVAGMGDGEHDATVTLSIESTASFERYPIDCLFVIDTSATADLSSAKGFAFDLIDRLSPNDRVGLIAYADTVRLAVPLTDDRTSVKAAIADLSASGKSALGAALQAARRALGQSGRDDAILVVILLSDGQSNIGVAPDVEGEVAGEMGIMIVPVGIGTMINRNLLEDLAVDSGGVFYPRPTDRALSGIIEHLSSGIAARELTVEKTLPAELSLIESTPRPTSVEANPDGTTSVVWRLADIGLGGSVSIEIRLQALARGEWKTDLDSTVSYVDFRGVGRSVMIPPVILTAVEPNRAPRADFAFSPDDPNTMDVITFVDRSSDDDGEVTGWKWDFGDGTTSVEPAPEHRFLVGGTYPVSLVVTDDHGLASSPVIHPVTVAQAPSVIVERSIDTCLPDDVTVNGAIVNVTITLTVNSPINGLSVTETIPDGWEFTAIDDDGATRREVGQTIEWIFLERFLPDDVDAQREIHYTLTAPSAVPSDNQQLAIGGDVGSSSPRFSQGIAGEDKLTLVRELSIPVVISRWDTANDLLDPCLGETIGFDQIQYAVSLWLSEDPVPYTDNRTIDLATIQDLIAYWLTGSSVHDPLP